MGAFATRAAFDLEGLEQRILLSGEDPMGGVLLAGSELFQSPAPSAIEASAPREGVNVEAPAGEGYDPAVAGLFEEGVGELLAQPQTEAQGGPEPAPAEVALAPDGGPVEISLSESESGSILRVIDTGRDELLFEAFAAGVSRLTVFGSAADDQVAIQLPQDRGPPVLILDDSGSDSDVLRVLGGDLVWRIDGDGAGSVGLVAFEGIENLAGDADNEDTFVLAEGGQLAGLIDGGPGGFDTLVIEGATEVEYVPDASTFGSGVIRAGGHAVRFANLEPVVLDGGATGPHYWYNSVTGTLLFITPGARDQVTIDSPSAGWTRVSGTTGGTAFESITFRNIPHVIIDLGAYDTPSLNADTVTVASGGLAANGLLSLALLTGQGADTITFSGGEVGLPAANGTLELSGADLTVSGTDDLEISANVRTSGRVIFTAPASITVADGVTISSRKLLDGADPVSGVSIGASGNLTFDAPSITVGQGARILAHATAPHAAGDVTFSAEQSVDLEYIISETVSSLVLGLQNRESITSITLDTGATVTGRNIWMTATASTAKLAELSVDLVVDTRSVALGDVDGDDHLDLVLGNYGTPNQLYLNDGDGDPWDTVTPTDLGGEDDAGDLTQAVLLVDVDGDGDLDLVVGNDGANRIYKNDGDGEFTLFLTSTETDDTRALAAADLDGDGKPDIVAGNHGHVSGDTEVAESNRIYWSPGLLAQGATWTGLALGSQTEFTTAVAIADFDGDGRKDVLVGNGDAPLDEDGLPLAAQPNRIYRNLGARSFSLAFTTTETDDTRSLAAGDVNGDGLTDFVVGNNGVNRVYLQGGGGAFTASVIPLGSEEPAYNSRGLLLEDWDEDGRLDLIVGNFGEPNEIYLNDGAGNPFDASTHIELGNINVASSVAAGDVDDDGAMDLVAGYEYQVSRLFLHDGTECLITQEKELGARVDESIFFEFSLFAAVLKAKAEAIITIGAGAVLDATGELTLRADSLARASETTFSTFLGVSVGITDATSKILIGDVDGTGAGGATIHAGGRFTAEALVTNTLYLDLYVPSIKNPANFSFAYGRATSTSEVTISDGSTVTAGSAKILAENTNDFSTSAMAFGFQPSGPAAVSATLVISIYNSTATTSVDGRLDVSGDTSIRSVAFNERNRTVASASVINSKIAGKIAGGIANGIRDAVMLLAGKFPLGSLDIFDANMGLKLAISAAINIALTDNAATASIAPGADVDVDGDLLLEALAENYYKAYSTASAGEASISVGGALNLSKNENTADAYIGEGAHVDVAQELKIRAEATIPIPVDFFDLQVPSYNPDQHEGTEKITEEYDNGVEFTDVVLLGVEAVKLFLITGGAIGEAFTTTFAHCGTSPRDVEDGGSKAGIAVAVNLFFLTNEADAHIGKNAQVNQGFTSRPADQDVKVEAWTSEETLDLAGQASVIAIKSSYGLGGGSGDFGVGATFAIALTDSGATAYIGEGARVSAGRDVEVVADSFNWHVVLAQAGTKAEHIGIDGAITVADIDDETFAYIDDQAVVDAGRNVLVKADSYMFVVDGTFGLVITTTTPGQQDTSTVNAGVGVSASVTDLDSTTHASIADRGGVLAGLPGSVTAGNDLTVFATSVENSWVISLSGAVTTAPPGGSGKYGVGISGDAAVNLVDSDTQAYIVTNGSVTAGNKLTVEAKNDSTRVAGAGAVAFGSTVGIGGSLAWNQLDKTTKAFTRNVTLRSAALDVLATADDIAVTAAAGAAIQYEGSGGSKAFGSVAGSAAINDTTMLTLAGLGAGTEAHVTGDVTVKAEQDGILVSVAGAISIAAGANSYLGAGLALSVVTADESVIAFVGTSAGIPGVDSDEAGPATLTVDAGDVRITATNDDVIVSVAACLALSVQKGAGASGSVSTVVLERDVRAFAGDESTLSTSKSLFIDASDETVIIDIAGAIGGGKNGGVGLAAASTNIDRTVQAYIGAGATVTALGQGSGISDSVGFLTGETFGGQGIALDATTDDLLVTVAVGIAVGVEHVGVAVSASVNTLNGDTLDSTPGDEDGNLTESFVGAGAQVNTDNTGAAAAQDVELRARHELLIVSVSGDFAYGGKFGLGAAAEVEVIETVVRAHIDADAVVRARRNVRLEALSDHKVISIALGIGASADLAGIAGSAVVITHTTTTQAFLGERADVEAGGSIGLAAESDVDLYSAVGAVGVANRAGIGIGVSTIVKNDTVEAFIGDGARVAALGGVTIEALTGSKDDDGDRETRDVRGLSVTATSYEKVLAIAVAAGIGVNPEGAAGVAASATVNVLKETTRAYIGENATINGNADGSAMRSDLASGAGIYLLASDLTNLNGAAGSAGLSGSVGVGALADVAVMNKVTESYIGAAGDDDSPEPARAYARGDVEIVAVSSEDCLSVAGGLAAGLYAAVAATFGVSVLDIKTRAYLGAFSVVDVDGSLLVIANDAFELDVINVGLTIGAGSARLSVSVPIVKKTTEAFLGPASVANARGLGTGRTIYTGEFSITYRDDVNDEDEITPPEFDNDDADDPSLFQQRVATPELETDFHGVAIVALSRTDLEVLIASVGGGGGDLGLSGAVDVLTVRTYAFVGEAARVNQTGAAAGADQDVFVAAGSDLYHMGITGVLSITGGGGVGGGWDVSLLTHETKASIDPDARVAATGDVTVRAIASEKVLSIAASASLSGMSAGAGALMLLSLDSETHAFIDEGAVVVAGGNVLVFASDETDFDTVAGSAGLGMGVVGIGASVGVNLVTKDTRAFIAKDARVTANAKGDSIEVYSGDFAGSGWAFATDSAFQGVAVQAASKENIWTLAVAGATATSGVAVAGAVTVEIVDADTLAFIGEGAVINADTADADGDQSVSVAAVNDLKIFGIDAGVSGSVIGAIAGGVDIGIIRNDIAAFIADDATVNARQDVGVHALSLQEADSIAASASGSLVALAAAVSVYTISGNLEQDALDSLAGEDGDRADSFADDVIGADLLGTVLETFTASAFWFDPAAALPDTVYCFNPDRAVDVDANTIDLGSGHGLQTGDAVVYDSGVVTPADPEDVWGDPPPAAAAIGGLASGTTYYIIFDSAAPTKVKLASSAANALNGIALNLGEGATGSSHSLSVKNTCVDVDEDTIDLGVAHGLETGQAVVYSSGQNSGGSDCTPIGGLTSGATYYVIADDAAPTKVQLAASEADALNGIEINLTGGATGANHSLALPETVEAFGAAEESAEETPEDPVSDGTGSSVSTPCGTSAYIGDATVTAGRHVDIDARERVDFYQITGAVTIGLGGSAGASVGVASVSGQAKAYVAAGAQIAAGTAGTVSIDAQMGVKMRGGAFVGAAGFFVGLGAQVVIFSDHSDAEAYIGTGAAVTQAGAVRVQAVTDVIVTGEAMGGSLGIVAAGAAIVRITVDGSTQAYVADGVQIGQGTGSVGSLTVLADASILPGDSVVPGPLYKEGVMARTLAVAAGIGAGVGNDAKVVIEHDVKAYIGDADVTVTGAVSVAAVCEVEANTDTMGVSAGGLAIGVSLSKTELTSELDAHIAAGASVIAQGGGIEVIARFNTDEQGQALLNDDGTERGARGKANASGGSLAQGNGAEVRVYCAPDLVAYIGAATIDASGTVTIAALSSREAHAEGGTFTIGLIVGVGGISAKAYSAQKPDGTRTSTKAYLAANAILTAGGLEIKAYSIDNAYTRTKGSGGGIVSVTCSEALARSAPKIGAYVGGSASVTVTHDVIVDAVSSTDADATARGATGGGVDVNDSDAEAEIELTVEGYIASGASVDAGTDVMIRALSNQVEEELPVPGEFVPATDVATGTDTIRVANHGLLNGDQVSYDSQGNTLVGGLAEDRDYGVIVVDSDHIQLGMWFDASQIDGNRDLIRFPAAHGLTDGERVVYDAAGNTPISGLTEGAQYIVKVIDERTIKLRLATQPEVTKTFTPSAVDASADTIFISGHGFTAGQPVTYYAPPGQTFTNRQVDVVVNSDGTLARDPVTEQILRDADANNIYLPNHGWSTGQRVTYDPNLVDTDGDGTLDGTIGGLPAGDYWVIRKNAYSIQLAASSAASLAGTAIALVPETDPADLNVEHRISLRTQRAIAGLTDGRTYYVIVVDADRIQLAATAGGTAITTLSGAGRTGTHKLMIEGADIAPGSGSQKLRIDLTSQPGGTHQLLGPGGTPFNRFNPPSGDGKASTTAEGSSGGLVAVRGTEATSTVEPTVRAYFAGLTLTAGRDVTILSYSRAEGEATSDNSSGGFVAAGDATAKVEIDNSSEAYVGDDSTIDAAGDITISAESKNRIPSAHGEADGGGFIDLAEADATAKIDHATKATVGAGASLAAGGTIAIASTTSSDAKARPDADARGFGANTDANDNGRHVDSHERGVWVGDASGDPATTTTEVEAGASLTARTVLLDAIVSKLKAQTDADAYAGGLGADCDATAGVLVYSRANVLIGANAVIFGPDEVTIRARHEHVDTDSEADGECDAAGGDTDVTAINQTETASYVSAAAGSDITSHALYVEAVVETDQYRKDADKDGAALDDGDEDERGDHRPVRYIIFNSHVLVSGLADPELHVDATGTIVTAINVSVWDTDNPTKTSGTILYEDVVVNDIIFEPGSITFFVNDVGRRVDDGDPNDEHGYITGTPTFDYNTGFNSVTILNECDKDLVINKIHTTHEAPPPVVIGWWIDSSEHVLIDTFVYDGPNKIFIPTVVTITNLGLSNIIFNEPGGADDAVLIDNPIGTTTVLNAQGDILDASTRASTTTIRGAFTSISAPAGSIGTAARPIKIQLVQESIGTATTPMPTLSLDALDDIFVRLQGVLREDAAFVAEVVELSGNGDVVVDIIDGIKQTEDGTTHEWGGTDPVTTTYRFNEGTGTGDVVVTGPDTADGIFVHIDLIGLLNYAGGTISISTDGNITRGDSDQLLAAEVLTLNSWEGYIGTGAANIQTDVRSGKFYAWAKLDIWINEIVEAINVGTVVSDAGSVYIHVTDVAAPLDDLFMDPTDSITALTVDPSDPLRGNVTLWVGDNVTMFGTIRAGRHVLIHGDYLNADPGVGSVIEIHGPVYAARFDIVTEVDDDYVRISVIGLGTPTHVWTDAGDDIVRLGFSIDDSVAKLDRIEGEIWIDVGPGANRLEVSDRNAPFEGNPLNGYGSPDGTPEHPVIVNADSIGQRNPVTNQPEGLLAPVIIHYLATGGSYRGGVWIWGGNGQGTTGNAILVESTFRSVPRSITRILAGSGHDWIRVRLDAATDGYTVIAAEGGNDFVDARESTLPMVIFGDVGNDEIYGGSGADHLFGDKGELIYMTPGTTVIDEVITSEDGEKPYGIRPILLHPPVESVLAQSSSTYPALGGLDKIYGEGGGDFIMGAAATDWIDGGEGDDLIFGDHAQIDFVPYGGGSLPAIAVSTYPCMGGPDTLYAGAGNDLVVGGVGSDSLYGVAGSNILMGGHALFDWISDGDPTTLNVAQGIYPGLCEGEDYFYGGEGDDVIVGGDGSDWIYGGGGNDVLVGDLAQIFFGSVDGHFTVCHLISIDPLVGGGSDRLYGEGGDDVLVGGPAGDWLDGGIGHDVILGDNAEINWCLDGNPRTIDHVRTIYAAMGGSDRIIGDDGNDVMLGGMATDDIDGGAGDDIGIGDNGRILFASNDGTNRPILIETTDPIRDVALGSDTVRGGPGNDILFGGVATDQLLGGDGNDVLFGDFGRLLYMLDGDPATLDLVTTTTGSGGAAGDQLIGDDGDDVLFGGPGVDHLVGGMGGSDRVFEEEGFVDYQAGASGQVPAGLPQFDQSKDFAGQSLRKANFQGADLQGASFYGANLQEANLQGALLMEAYLHGANLTSANLRGADLTRAKLIGASLIGANLRDAVLVDAYLDGANLDGADLRGADLTGVFGLTWLQLQRAKIDGTTVLPDYLQ